MMLIYGNDSSSPVNHSNQLFAFNIFTPSQSDASFQYFNCTGPEKCNCCLFAEIEMDSCVLGICPSDLHVKYMSSSVT
ncbi:hypothetical protein XELAEV_18005092mg [Xenopus laevis]|uniref:Uncharacterized protein n=1 Tax=Xenopus laevis TaxID=8355 RepID=A0A974I2T0_XENLA|nr:hypothetical protein XELAEV_18005092mg [Xenopus laevis]